MSRSMSSCCGVRDKAPPPPHAGNGNEGAARRAAVRGERWSTDSVSVVFEPGRRLPKRSSGQAGRPAPLRSAVTQVCERPNIQTAPPSEGRSLVYLALIFVDSNSCFF